MMKTPVFLSLLTLWAAALPAAAQEGEEPVGWPYRPKQQERAAPMPERPKPAPGGDEADAAAPPEASGSQRRPIDTGITPLERVLLPIRPLGFVYDKERIALTRDELNQLRRLAERLKAGDERVLLSSHAAPDGDGRAALERALARALLVRSLLIEEGIALRRITLRAEPVAREGLPAEMLEISRAE